MLKVAWKKHNFYSNLNIEKEKIQIKAAFLRTKNEVSTSKKSPCIYASYMMYYTNIICTYIAYW